MNTGCNKTRQALGNLAERTVMNMKKAIRRGGKHNTGKLEQSITWKFTQYGVVFIIDSDYAKYVISGRRSGAKQPPSRSILSWLDTPHGIRAYANMRRRWRTISKKSAAFLIARHIGQKGIKPMDFYNPSINTLYKVDAYHELEEAYAYCFEHQMIKEFKKII